MSDDLSRINIAGYRMVEVIGHGGFGMVVRAHQEGLDRDVAIKIGYQPLADDSARRRFERECRTLGSLSGHSHIVSVKEAGHLDDGRPWLAMDYHPQGSLGALLAEHGALAWPRVREIGIKLSGALHDAHTQGVLHRDIKPDNVLLSRWDEPVLVDFGIARFASEEATRTGNVTASIGFAPPEVLSGERGDPRSDVYSLAATLAGLAMGRAPFALGHEDVSIAARIARVVTGPVPDLRHYGVPEDGAAVIAASMAKDPDQRPPTARVLGDQLAATRTASPGSHSSGGGDGILVGGTAPPRSVPPAPIAWAGHAPPVRASAGADPAGGAPATPGPPKTPPRQSTGAGGAPARRSGGADPPPWLLGIGGVVLVALIAAIVVVIALSGGDTGDPPPPTDDPSSEPAPDTEPDTSGVDLDEVVLDTSELPAGFAVDSGPEDRFADPFLCGEDPSTEGLETEAASRYTDNANTSVVSEAARFRDVDEAQTFIEDYVALAGACATWDVTFDDGTVLTLSGTRQEPARDVGDDGETVFVESTNDPRVGGVQMARVDDIVLFTYVVFFDGAGDPAVDALDYLEIMAASI